MNPLFGGIFEHALKFPTFQRHLKDSHPAGTASIEAGPDSAFSFEFSADDPILCRACGHVITSVAAIIDIDGRHSHCFTNPAGVTYRLGCFSTADGCFVFGRPTEEFTWFSGFAWNLAFCQACSCHLGWRYQSSGASFFGLILDNLIERSTTH